MSRAEIEALLGDRPPSELLSTKSPRYKALGLESQALTEAEKLEWMAKEPTLIRRPSFKVGDRLVIGFDKAALEAALASS